MAFGNISAIYIPTAANAGASLWGTDVRKVLSSADAGSDSTTVTNHGTSTSQSVRTEDPYSTSSADSDQSLYGWAIDPTDMNSVTGARRFYPAGNHTTTVVIGHNGATSASATLYMYVYRVASAASGRTRTLLGSNSAGFTLPALGGSATVTVSVALPEVIFEPDETIQYAYELSAPGITITGRNATFYTGTQGGTATSIATPTLGVLADTTGSSSGVGTASGLGGKVLGTDGSAAGIGAASGLLSALASTTGAGAGIATVSGLLSAVASVSGSASGVGTAAAEASVVLSGTGIVNIGAGAAAPVYRPIILLDG